MLKKLYEVFEKHPQVVTDSRKVTPGCLFFALKGTNFDGNEFAEQALAEGAAFAVIDNPAYRKDKRTILVADVLESLQSLAIQYRKTFDIPVIGITGSNGKTTTKELVAAVMGAKYRTHYTQGNLNNHIGVPLTILAMARNTEIAIIEMGANHEGEIDLLCQIAQPTHGLITNIGKAHLEGFGGIEGVKRGKGELYRYLAECGGTVFVNRDEAHLAGLLSTDLVQIGYRKKEHPSLLDVDYEARLIREQPYLRIGFINGSGEMLETETKLVGAYNFGNLLAAIAVGKYFKVRSADIKRALESYVPSNNRSQLMMYRGATVVMDAYNANPSSMREALTSFRKMPFEYKIAIIGDMRELGPESEKEHRDIYAYAESLSLDALVTVGTEFGKVSNAESVHFANTDELKGWLNSKINSLDSIKKIGILIKGSRGMQLEKVLA